MPKSKNSKPKPTSSTKKKKETSSYSFGKLSKVRVKNLPVYATKKGPSSTDSVFSC